MLERGFLNLKLCCILDLSQNGDVAQLARALDWQSRGRRFEWMKNIQYIEEINFGAGYQNLGIKKFTSVPYSNYSFASQHVYMDFPKSNFYVGANEPTTGKATRTIALGIGSGFGIEGEDNVSIGISTSSRLKGSENVAIGSNSMVGGLNFASTHYGNGVYSIPNINTNEISDRNTAVGFNSMNAIDGGYQNSSFGWNSMNSNTGGFKNTAIGSHSLAVNTIGNINTAIGEVALHWNLDGDNNTAVGHGALFANTSGNENTAVGTSALNNLEDSYNVGIGKFAGTSLISGTLNTAIGYRSDISNNLFNSTAIGANATVTSSNTIQLGNTDVTLVNTSGDISASDYLINGGESLVDLISQMPSSSINNDEVNYSLIDELEMLRGMIKKIALEIDSRSEFDLKATVYRKIIGNGSVLLISELNNNNYISLNENLDWEHSNLFFIMVKKYYSKLHPSLQQVHGI